MQLPVIKWEKISFSIDERNYSVLNSFLLVFYYLTLYICIALKRILCILFCCLYLASSAGVNFNLHYCSGKLKSISFFHHDEKSCCGSKMKKKNCCKDKSVVYKAKETQNGSSKITPFKNSSPHFIVLFSGIFLIKINSCLIIVPALKEPPDIVYDNTYLVNRTFLI